MLKFARSIVRGVAIIGATIAMALTMSIVSLRAMRGDSGWRGRTHPRGGG